ncbi:MAG: hypothetical protein EAX96_07470 [Candidatus Lokiarchaeota archaeon]|nr:hypothetical protein [Candidatus Lokiarchaeota archaeon]
MKIAVLYDSKYGNTKQVAEFLADKMQVNNNQIRLFRTKESKPKDLLSFQPEIMLVGGPTHFGKPTRTLKKYIKSLGKSRPNNTFYKVAVFNCNIGGDICKLIEAELVDVFPKVEIFKYSLPITVCGMQGPLPDNWKEDATNFISAFLNGKELVRAIKEGLWKCSKAGACGECRYIYDEEKEGKPFEQLPDNWKCPLCKSSKSQFRKLNVSTQNQKMKDN